ncbi:hypothetical protein, partial [Shewanella vaxholmensis]|uniref:hypothetical protein n=1 Tax=Shewanella vaxholmensis TaxID=3063535 RepID=UPI002891F484
FILFLPQSGFVQQTPQDGLSTRGVSCPNEQQCLWLLCLSLVLCVVSPLGGRYAFLGEFSVNFNKNVSTL